MPVTSHLKSHLQKSLTASVIALSFTLGACADQSTADAAASSELAPALASEQTVSKAHANPQEQASPNVQEVAQNRHQGSHDGHAHGEGDNHGEGHAHGADGSPMIFPAVDFATTEAPEDHVMGDATAPITVISYASVTCPHCGDWFTKDWPQFKSELIETGKVRFIFREFPTQPVQLAMAGFLIANCADESRFFEAIEYQMENQASIFESAQAGTAKETYVAIAQKFGLKDEAEMQACLSNPEEVKRIETSMARAQSANVRGAPAFIINETLFKGNPSYAALKAAIDLESETGVSKMDKR